MGTTDEMSKGEANLLCPDTRFIYELDLPQGLQPAPNDDEVEEFMLLSVHEIMNETISGECTPGNALILIDYFIRRGVITYENEPDYLEIITRLHRNHNFSLSK
jgi:hypothetical protein